VWGEGGQILKKMGRGVSIFGAEHRGRARGWDAEKRTYTLEMGKEYAAGGKPWLWEG